MGGRRLFAGLVFASAVLALLLHLWMGAATCGEEGSQCIEGDQRLAYHGRIFDFSGRPLANGRVEVALQSRDYGRDGRETVAADRQGRFCLEWWREPGPAPVEVASGTAAGRADPRYVRAAKLFREPSRYSTASRLVVVPPSEAGQLTATARLLSGNTSRVERLVYEGTFTTSAGWRAQTDAAGSCPDLGAAVAWDRFEDLESNWRYVLVFALSLLTMVFAVATLSFVPLTRRIAAVGASLVAANCLVFALIWQNQLT